MAGEAVSPGDSMPARTTRPGASLGASMTKSPVLPVARSPAKVRITWRGLREGTSPSAPASTSSRPSAVVRRSSLAPTSTALGPSITLPWMVRVTRIPLLTGVGQGKRTVRTASAAALSRTKYSPLRGVMVKPSSPAACIRSSAHRPAAMTTQRERTTPRSVMTPAMRPSGASPSLRKPVTSVSRATVVPFITAFSAAAMHRPKGSTMPPLRAQRAPTVEAFTPGSAARSASPGTMAMSGTPFSRPRR